MMTLAADTQREPGSYRHDVVGNVLISTILRESSALVNNPPLYYETMAFSNEDGTVQMLWMSAATHQQAADRQHDLAVRWFRRTA